MPKVRMLQSMAGPNLSYIPGDLVQVSDEIAAAWCSPETLIARPADDEAGEPIDHAKASAYVAGNPAPGPVAIPENWAELPEADVLALAAAITGKEVKKRSGAMAAINAELKKRQAAAAAAARAAVEIPDN
jgi:hypothetical protein